MKSTLENLLLLDFSMKFNQHMSQEQTSQNPTVNLTAVCTGSDCKSKLKPQHQD